MRTVYVAVCVVLGGLVGAKLATADRQVETKETAESPVASPSVATGGTIVCPLWPIYDYGNGVYMFYAERYDNLECLNPQAAIYVGSAPGWPYLCPDCESASLVAPETEHCAGGSGLRRPVNADFQPTFPEHLRANEGVSVSDQGFFEFKPRESNSIRRIKLFRVTIDRTAEGNRKRVARTIGLGYEVSQDQQSIPMRNIEDAQFSILHGSRNTYKMILGAEEFLILLAE